MPQLSLYVDEKMLQELQIAAEIEHLSISKYAVKKLNESMHSKWPNYYEDLYGCISDNTFVIDKINNFHNDIPREEL